MVAFEFVLSCDTRRSQTPSESRDARNAIGQRWHKHTMFTVTEVINRRVVSRGESMRGEKQGGTHRGEQGE